MAEGNLLKNSFIYSLFILLQRGLSFFLLPLYTIYLTKNQYGILSLLMAAIPFFVLIAGMSLRGSTYYYYYLYKNNNKYLKKLYGTCFTFLLIFTLIFTLLLVSCKELLIDYFFKGIDFCPYLLLAFLSVLFQPAYFYYQSYLKGKQLATLSATLDFIYFIILISLTLVFVLIFNMQAEGVLLALAIANFMIFVVTIIKFSKDIEYGLNLRLLKKSLSYSLPILPHNLSSWAMNLADRIILNSLTTLEVVATFDIGAQIGKLINIVTLGVNSAYSPWFFEQTKLDNFGKNKLAKTAEGIVFFYIFCSIVISWFSPEIINIISKNGYDESWKVVPLISYAFAINGFYFCFSNVFFLDKTKVLPLLSLAGAVINISINLYLIPRMGFIGAGLASLFSKLLFCFIAYRVSQRYYRIPYNIFKIIIAFAIGAIMVGSVFVVQPNISELNVWIRVTLKTLCLFMLIAPILLTNRNKIKEVINFRKR